jgi:hypothetical protein
MNIHTISNNPGPSSNGSWSESLQEWWSRCPLFTRFIIYTSVIIYILSWIFIELVLFFCNIPFLTINKYHLWTIFTTAFVNLHLLTLLFALWSWVDISVKLENRSGTMHFILNFFVLNSLIQVVYLTTIILLSYIYPPFYMMPSAGLWPLIMSLITIECLRNPEADYFFFCSFKAKYYPWILLLFFMIFNQFVIQVDVLAGILFGYISFYYLERYIEIPITTALSLENTVIFSWMKTFSSNYSI